MEHVAHSMGVGMSEFRAGDVVRLKSRGPMMTVTGINYQGYCICAWFVGNEEFSAIYPPVALYSEQQVNQMAAAAADELG